MWASLQIGKRVYKLLNPRIEAPAVGGLATLRTCLHAQLVSCEERATDLTPPSPGEICAVRQRERAKRGREQRTTLREL